MQDLVGMALTPQVSVRVVLDEEHNQVQFQAVVGCGVE